MANTKSTTATKRAKQAKRTTAAPAPATPQRNGGNGANTNLAKARRAKNDEFYTQLRDIQEEIERYLEYNPDTFRGKVVYCNCDDPYESNFFRYFVMKFDQMGLKRLIATSYKPSPIANTQLPLFGNDKTLPKSKVKRPKITANKFIINKVERLPDGWGGIRAIAEQLKANKNNEWAPLEGNGDFRSEECIELLKQADIVVTNPPFSLFREFVKQLVEYDKDFLIIGNKNAITYKEIFPLIKDNKMWSGVTQWSGGLWFKTIDDEDVDKVIDGVNMKNVPSIWFTNLDHGRRHEPLPVMETEDCLRHIKELRGKKAYDKYDNYNAIDVPVTGGIPSDYKGVMGVPVSFLDRYNPDQFEILGSDYYVKEGLLPKLVNPKWKGKLDRGYVNGKRMYTRIFIRHIGKKKRAA